MTPDNGSASRRAPVACAAGRRAGDGNGNFGAYMVGWQVMLNPAQPVVRTISAVPSATQLQFAGDGVNLAAAGDFYRVFAPPGVMGDANGANWGHQHCDVRYGCSVSFGWAGYRYFAPVAGFVADHSGGGFAIHSRQGADINLVGSYYCWNRQYSPYLGRWTTPDPLASPWWNLQDYCDNSPLQYTDMHGLMGNETDRDVERSFELDKAIADGRLKEHSSRADRDIPPSTGQQGKAVSKICDKPCCATNFNFDKAYTGTFDYSGRVARGVYVKISAMTNCCCKDLKFIQAARYTKGGDKAEQREIDDKARAARAGKGTDIAQAGWFIDTNRFDGYYSIQNPGTSGKQAQRPEMWDTPAEFDSSYKAGDGKSFITCLVCDKEILACVHWGYYVEKDGKVRFHDTSVSCGVPAEMNDALGAWNRWATTNKEFKPHDIVPSK